MSGYLRLTEAPEWCIQYPTCSACTVDLDTDGDGWTCPSCGTYWDMAATDGDKGTLYPDWSGEKLTGPAVSHDEAMSIAIKRQAEERRRVIDEILGRSGGSR